MVRDCGGCVAVRAVRKANVPGEIEGVSTSAERGRGGGGRWEWRGAEAGEIVQMRLTKRT